MANVSEKFGLRPYRKLDGTPLVGAQNRYTIASNMGHAIFQGDLVIVTTAGNIEKYNNTNNSAGLSTAAVGVFNGVFYTDPTTQKPTYGNYYPGNIVADDTPENLSNRLQTSNLCEIKVKNGKSNGIIKLLRNEDYIVDIRTKDDNNDEFENYYIETSSVKSPESLISKILINNNIDLYGLSSLPLTLEEIFLQLTKD